MKRYLLMILGACIAIPALFASCSSDDDSTDTTTFNMAYYLQGSYTTAVNVSKNGEVESSNVRTYLTITRISDTEARFSLDPVTIDGNLVQLECSLILAANTTAYIKFTGRSLVNIAGISNIYNIEGALTSLNSLEFYVYFTPSLTTANEYRISASGIKGSEISDPAFEIVGDYGLTLNVELKNGDKYKTDGGVTIEKVSEYVANMRFHDLSMGHLGVHDYFVPVTLSGNSLNVAMHASAFIQSPASDTDILRVDLDGLVTGKSILFTLAISTDNVIISASGSSSTGIIDRTLARDIYGLFNINYVVPEDENNPAPYSVTVTTREPQVRLSLTSSPELEDEITVNSGALDFTVTPEEGDPIAVKMEGSVFQSALGGAFGEVALSAAEEPNSVSLQVQTGEDEKGQPEYTAIFGTLSFEGGSIRQSHIAELTLNLTFTHGGNSYDIVFSGEGLQDF